MGVIAEAAINSVKKKIDDMANTADIYVKDWSYPRIIATDS